jgi:hypothetical protein
MDFNWFENDIFGDFSNTYSHNTILGCKPDKVNNLITLSKLEQVDSKYQQNPL